MHPRPQCEDEPRSPGFARPDNMILTYLPNGIGSGTGADALREYGHRVPSGLLNPIILSSFVGHKLKNRNFHNS